MNPLLQKPKSLGMPHDLRLEGLRILHNILIYHNNVEVAVDYHVFDIQSFDIMIGHPLEKFIMEPPASSNLDVKLGRDSFSIPITRAKNLVAYSLPHSKLPEEVMYVSPFESPESSLEKDAEFFVKEEDDLGETIDLPKEEALARPLVELKPLPTSLRYAFLNDDTETPVIINDKISDEETSKLIAILEKHRLVFGYSLQDLKGINPTLCTHHIPIDPSSTPSREP
jgi:hypothetical protein